MLIVFIFGCNTTGKTEEKSTEIEIGSINKCFFIKKDDTNVYFNTSIIKEADVATFEQVKGEDRIYKDKNAVYYVSSGKHCESSIHSCPGADLETFDILESNYYAKDKNHVYKGGEILENADPATFDISSWFSTYVKYEPISGCYTMYKYSSNVYFNDDIIFEADASTFEAIERDERLYKDKNNVYSIFHGEGCTAWLGIYKGSDPDTFELLDFYGKYAKDKNNVYFEGEILEGVNSATFEVQK